MYKRQILHSVYKLSDAKKAFALQEEALQKEIEKQNRHRGIFAPTDHKAHYETIAVNGFPCLIVPEHPKPSARAILYFFGGGMVIGPDTVSYTHLNGGIAARRTEPNQ